MKIQNKESKMTCRRNVAAVGCPFVGDLRFRELFKTKTKSNIPMRTLEY